MCPVNPLASKTCSILFKIHTNHISAEKSLASLSSYSRLRYPSARPFVLNPSPPLSNNSVFPILLPPVPTELLIIFRILLTFFHSLIHTRSLWICIAGIKTLSRVASQARRTACTHRIKPPSKRHTDVVRSRRQATRAVTISVPCQGTLSMRPPWVHPRIHRLFISIIRSKTKDTSVLDG